MAPIGSDRRKLFFEFNLPAQQLKELSFCSHKLRPFQQWLEELPATQAKHISAVLYKLLPEISQLAISGNQRLMLLNTVRPYVHNCIEGLSKEFLAHPLTMAPHVAKLAAIAQALQRHLCDAYMVNLKELLQTKSTREERSLAAYYAIHGVGQLLYRCHQLYIPRPPLIWQKLNQLYQLAIDEHIETTQIIDTLLVSRKSMSCQQVYFRILVLSCSNINQLREIDIQYLYNALEQWSSMIDSPPAAIDNKSIYWIDRASDDGPFYKTRHTDTPSNSVYAINLQHLIDLLHSHQSHHQTKGVTEIPVHFRQSLISHLMTCWHEQHERQRPRQQSNTELEICVGLSAAHQQLSEGLTFETTDDRNHLQKIPNHDTSSTNSVDFPTQNNTDDQMREQNQAIESEQIIINRATASDISNEGYCLKWSNDVPDQIQSGEVLLLRKPGTQHWQAGTIRWAQRLNHHTYVGIQLLSGQIEAAMASTTLDNGDKSPFFRVLLLKETLSTNSLLVPTLPFTKAQGIQLQTEGRKESAKLTQLLMNSGTVSQYSFQYI